MKRTYETFLEVAEDFRDGAHWTHALSKHTSDECLAWQHGALEFGKWLDECGLKIVQNPGVFTKLWGRIRTHKPIFFKVLPHKEQT